MYSIPVFIFSRCFMLHVICPELVNKNGGMTLGLNAVYGWRNAHSELKLYICFLRGLCGFLIIVVFTVCLLWVVGCIQL